MNIYLFKNPSADDPYSYGYSIMIVVANSEDEAKYIGSRINSYGEFNKNSIHEFWVEETSPILFGHTIEDCEPGFISGNYSPYIDAWDD